MDFLKNVITELVYKKFDELPKKGKPQENKEWTLLAAVVLSHCDRDLQVVALSTGTKCIGSSFLSSAGEVVSDSHAEVLARRAFKRYLLHQISLVSCSNKSDCLEVRDDGHFYVKSDVKFHFFISHTPCGDASIFPKPFLENEFGTVLVENKTTSKRQMNVSDNGTEVENAKKVKLKHDVDSELPKSSFAVNNKNCPKIKTEVGSGIFPDIFRTGAKCVSKGAQDPKGKGVDYHTVGALRTKPGRGDPSISMSCSDKIALWNICGLQGALLSHFIPEPIYLSCIVIGKCPFNEDAMQRAILERSKDVKNLPKGYCQNDLKIYQSDNLFKYSKKNMQKYSVKVVPCPASIIWVSIPGEDHEVCVNGRKQGITKKELNKPSSWMKVCRRKIFQEFSHLLHSVNNLPESLRNIQNGATYLEYKIASSSYQAAKSAFFKTFDGWVKKSKTLQEFNVVLT